MFPDIRKSCVSLLRAIALSKLETKEEIPEDKQECGVEAGTGAMTSEIRHGHCKSKVQNLILVDAYPFPPLAVQAKSNARQNRAVAASNPEDKAEGSTMTPCKRYYDLEDIFHCLNTLLSRYPACQKRERNFLDFSNC